MLEDVYILLTDQEISNVLQIETVLKAIVSGGHKPLPIGGRPLPTVVSRSM